MSSRSQNNRGTGRSDPACFLLRSPLSLSILSDGMKSLTELDPVRLMIAVNLNPLYVWPDIRLQGLDREPSLQPCVHDG
ncbi:hypothetical protein GCM10009096_32370 [Parasphingorhabdus litoris]|uniref:Uncharacterized protein n=1 Tax=Parasphingorhabdus litoris TaxID=394733 RepID=A0ABP3KU56_9SPHN